MRLTVQSGYFDIPSGNSDGAGIIVCRVYWEKQYDSVTKKQYFVLVKGYACSGGDSVVGTYLTVYTHNGTNTESIGILVARRNTDEIIDLPWLHTTSEAERMLDVDEIYVCNDSLGQCFTHKSTIRFPVDIEITEQVVGLYFRVTEIRDQGYTGTLGYTKGQYDAVELAEEITTDGVVYIHNGTEYKKGILLIHDGTEFKRGIPLVHNGTEFVSCK